MAVFHADFISLADVYLGYRKSKSDAYYESSHLSVIAYSEFERNLKTNIEKLHAKLITGVDMWWCDSEFIGQHMYMPKSIDDSNWDRPDSVHYRSIDPSQDWMQRFHESRDQRVDASYRLIIEPTVEYQVISNLWIMKVGHKFEEKLDRKLSYGNRLRRKNNGINVFKSLNGSVNLDSSGLFEPYFSAYRNWRQKGLDAMEALVSNGSSATAVTMDLAGFYHNVSPRFLLRNSFLSKIGVEMNKDELKFTQLILESISNWYEQTPDFEDRNEGALPVGSSVSKIISNVLLYELDNQIKDSLLPTYYGRYVDDIFIVLETPENATDGTSIMEHFVRSVDCLFLDRKKGSPPGLKVNLNYATDSDLRFTASKQKIFSLSAGYGQDLINQISSQIRAQSSEYRMLPEVPRNSADMAEKALLASSDASLIADALRKADVVSIRRLGMSLLIRDIESYSTDLSRDEWTLLRHEFYGLVQRYLLSPKGMFELSGYYSRIFKLMVSNHDFVEANEFVNQLSECFQLIAATTKVKKGRADRTRKCKQYFEKHLLQTALQASTTKNFNQWEKLRKLLVKVSEFSSQYELDTRKSNLKKLSSDILHSDLGSRSYKDYWFYEQDKDINKVKVPRSKSVQKVLRLASIRSFRRSANLKQPHWPALVFPTRPLTIQEIALICPKVLDDHVLFRRSIFGLRGARTQSKIGVERSVSDGKLCEISVSTRQKEKINVGLTNFETTNEQFSKALNGAPDRSLGRYEKTNRLVNDILRASHSVDYVVFPECSIPLRWSIGIAAKLARQGISFISGIEYYKDGKKPGLLRNDCLVSLVSRWPGYASNIIFLQPKMFPSHGELEQLKKAGKKQYIPTSSSETLPVYRHGAFHFGVLICSDLTNPRSRVRFQGKVDCLMVLEWNPDVKTFSFLIEGTAHDVHAFVVQVNNRMYGDSRVRAPYRADYKRDAVRIKGGLEDYYVIAELDYESLRKFQSKGKMTDKKSEFKPVPIGFKMSKSRVI